MRDLARSFLRVNIILKKRQKSKKKRKQKKKLHPDNVRRERERGTRSASLGLTDYSHVGILGVHYKSTNFGAEKQHIDKERESWTLSRECGTYKTDRARLWPWLSGGSPHNSRKVDVRLSGLENSNSHRARPVH